MKKIALLITLFVSQNALAWTILSPNLRGWQDETLTFSLNTADCPLSQADMESALTNAVEAWNRVPGARLSVAFNASTTDVTTFLAGGATDAPVILCDPNLSANLGSDSENIPGVAMRISGNPNITYGGILLNAEAGKSAEISNLSTLQLEITMAHEIGHVLGLGHSSIENALMYFSIANKTEVLVGEDDRDAIRFLYPRNEFSGGVYGCSAVHNRNTPTKNHAPYIMGYFLLLFAIARWGRRCFSDANRISLTHTSFRK